MSSGCAPIARIVSGPSAGAFRCNGSTAGSLRLGRGYRHSVPAGDDLGKSTAHRRGAAGPFGIPDHPGAVALVVHLIELGPFLHRVRGRPVALIRVSDDPSLRDQAPHDRV